MISRFYKWFHKITSKPQEAGEYSAGYWPGKVRVAALDICIDRPERFLEVGCGEGLFLSKLSLLKPRAEIWGIDNRDDMLEKARNRTARNKEAAIKFQRGDACLLPFENNFFNTIVCVNVLFNMASMEMIKKSLCEMARVCASGGSIIFDYRNALNPLLKIKYGLAKYYDPSVKDLPLTTCRSDEIEAILSEAGLVIKRRIAISFPRGKYAPIVLLEAVKL